jgi:hypothetical protein
MIAVGNTKLTHNRKMCSQTKCQKDDRNKNKKKTFFFDLTYKQSEYRTLQSGSLGTMFNRYGSAVTPPNWQKHISPCV